MLDFRLLFSRSHGEEIHFQGNRRRWQRFMFLSVTWSKLDNRSIVRDIFGKMRGKVEPKRIKDTRKALKPLKFVAS